MATEDLTPTDEAPVLYRVSDRVAEITLNRPHASNAFHNAMARCLTAALAEAVEDDDVHTILLAGAGPRFCGGGDLAAVAASDDRSAYIGSLARLAHEAVLILDRSSKPVVVAVQGAAAGIGMAFVLAADIVVAGESARFVTAYTSVGLTPDGGLSWRLPRAVGERVATELILTSRPVSAARGAELGLVSVVCPDGEVLATARASAVQLATRPPRAVAAARALVRSARETSLSDHLDLEASSIARAAGDVESHGLIDNFLGR